MVSFSAFTGYDHLPALAMLGKGIEGARKNVREDEQRRTLASLGQNIDGTPEGYNKAAQALLGMGDTSAATNFLALGEQARERSLTEAARKSSPFAIQPSGGASASGSGGVAAVGQPNEIENEFVGTVRQAGLTNPVGLAAVAAYGKAESGYSPQNVNRVWDDPSQSGQPGQAGGIMSWRADRLQNLQRFAVQNGEQPSNISPKTQAMFLAQEDPQLIPRLNAAKSPEEANSIMANAWRFSGFDQPGGENARRLAMTKNYLPRFAGQSAAVPAQTQSAQAPQGAPQAGVYTNTPVEELQAFISNPRVPDNLRGLMQQELARRGGGQPAVPAGAPVQIAQAPSQPGALVADVPAQGSAPAGFNVPGSSIPPNDPFPQVTTQQLYGVLNDPRLKNDHAIATQILQNRMKYSDENAPDKRRAVRLQNEKAQLDIDEARRKAGGKGFRVLNSQERAEAGVDPSYKGVVQIDREGQLFFPGKASTEVNVGSGEKSFDQTVGKAYGEQFVEIQKGARDASKTLGTVGMMERLMQTPGFYSGLGGERSLAVNRALVSLGIKDPKAATAQEAFQALSNQVVLDAAGGSLGAQISNGDREYINATAPNLANTPEGNKELLSIRRKMAERQQIIGKMARDYAKANGGRLDAGFDEQVGAFAEANPLFKPAAPAAAPGAPAPQNAAPRAVTSPADYEALKPGETFTDPQGNIRTKR